MRAALCTLAALLLSCQDATQITVTLRGVGFVCSPDGQRPSLSSTSIVGLEQLGTSLEGVARATGSSADCAGDEPRALGSVVLLPSRGAGPVEVLATAQLIAPDGTANAPDACLEAYFRVLAGGAIEADGFYPDLCVFARRSLSFREHSSLELTIDLSVECAGVVCLPSQTCEPERGCVDAVSSCRDDGTCTVSAGGGDAGGGGGGTPAAWSALNTPSDATPRDVVGAYLDGTQTTTLWVAAGKRLLNYHENVGQHVVAQSANTYAAVALRAGTDPPEVTAVGVQGLTFSTQAFGAFTTPGEWPAPIPSGARFDVAWPSTVPLPSVAVDTPDGCYLITDQTVLIPFVPCGLAVAATSKASVAISSGSGTATFQWAGNPPSNATVASDDYAVWAGEADPFVAYVVPQAGTPIWIVRNDGSEQQHVVTASAPPVVVEDVWGFDLGDGLWLYAVGSSSGPWLARARVDVDPFDWEELPLPPALTQPRGVWVGPEGATNPKIAVVGDGGVFIARLQTLLGSP